MALPAGFLIYFAREISSGCNLRSTLQTVGATKLSGEFPVVRVQVFKRVKC